ncbi:hypothetical protein TCCBUS3UF1_690 [Thermus sp. CCB_US3_UF1]|nr:hypothetical protein TCCBUS3UF1_690 [Thermus sp. CCB_US3_UF1]
MYRPSGFWDYTWEILSDAKVLEPAPSLEAVVKLVQRFLKESEDQLEPGNRYKIITYTPARALEMHLIRPLLTPSELARAEHGFFFEATWGNPTPKAEADLFPLKKRD